MNDEFEKALNAYKKTFNDDFPTFQMSAYGPEEMTEFINECVKKKKDVYQLNYLVLDDSVQY